MKILTVNNAQMNIRRGMNKSSEYITPSAKMGDRFDVIAEFMFDELDRRITTIPQPPADYSHWAQVDVKSKPGQNLYICVKGYGIAKPYCLITDSAGVPIPPPTTSPEFDAGFSAGRRVGRSEGLDEAIRALAVIRAKE